jgi:hypothetical protein
MSDHCSKYPPQFKSFTFIKVPNPRIYALGYPALAALYYLCIIIGVMFSAIAIGVVIFVVFLAKYGPPGTNVIMQEREVEVRPWG